MYEEIRVDFSYAVCETVDCCWLISQAITFDLATITSPSVQQLQSLRRPDNILLLPSRYNIFIIEAKDHPCLICSDLLSYVLVSSL